MRSYAPYSQETVFGEERRFFAEFNKASARTVLSIGAIVFSGISFYKGHDAFGYTALVVACALSAANLLPQMRSEDAQSIQPRDSSGRGGAIHSPR